MNNRYDVIICGAGLAAQTLARQLKLNYPDIKVLMLAKEVFPLPVAAHKVGESTVEIAAYYFAETLCLKDYFKNNQYTKLGLRYFFGDGRQPFAERPELGLSAFPFYNSYQIDRGVFENDLYRFNKMAGVQIVEGASVEEININEQGDHTVAYQLGDGKNMYTASARWVVDAMGRRSFLQKKFGLREKLAENCSAVWFRVPGRFDLDDFVDLSDLAWHQRVPNRIRYYSTNHIMGHGYWVWLIPLASGNTSVGIVTHESIHPCSNYNTREKAFAWLDRYEPVVNKALQGIEFMDFRIMRNYAYSSRQVFSHHRWACVGDAALFPDPFYSPGSNLIGFANSIVTKMIALEEHGQLTEQRVSGFNDFVISYNQWLLNTTHPSYSYFGDPQVMSLNYLWDLVVGWGIVVPQMFNQIYLSEQKQKAVREATARFSLISIRIKALFKQWETLVQDSFTFRFIDYLSVPFIKEIYNRNLHSNKSLEELTQDHYQNIRVLEAFARAIFLLAVEDVMPDKAALFTDISRVNPQALSLLPEQWEKDGLLLPEAPEDAREDILGQVRALYTFRRQQEKEKTVSAEFNFDFK